MKLIAWLRSTGFGVTEQETLGPFIVTEQLAVLDWLPSLSFTYTVTSWWIPDVEYPLEFTQLEVADVEPSGVQGVVLDQV